MALLPDIENGIPTDIYSPHGTARKRDMVASIGRICPEKGYHLALWAAKQVNCEMLLAGQTFAFPEHERYFNDQIAPELDDKRRFIGPVRQMAKRRLLSISKCVMIPSLVEETSSLVAREALACGTPVVAFKHGALPEAIENGKTGFLVDWPDQLPDAIRACEGLDPQACRAAALERFSAERMVQKYIDTYYKILRSEGGLATAL